MEHQTTSNTGPRLPLRVPIIAWVLGGGLLIALAAIFVFNVPLSTVGYYALIALFMGSHFFMHRGHGGHGGQDRQGLNQERSASDSPSKGEHTGHSGGCH